MFKVSERLVSVCHRKFMERCSAFPKPEFAFERFLTLRCTFMCIPFTIHSFRVGNRLGLCRLTSAHPLIWSTIREFSLNFSPWILEDLCCLYRQSFYEIDYSTLWWTVVGVNWLMLCQVCRRAVFWAPLFFLLYTTEHFYLVEN